MTSSGESRKEATRTTPIISTRTTTNIAAWNVQTMYQTGKLYQVEKEFERYNLSILGISESRWKGKGKRKLSGGKLLLYSGKENEKAAHEYGVALMMSKQAKESLIDWEPHGERILRATFKTDRKRLHMDVIQCYAPCNTAEDEEKELFYERLGTIIEKLPRRNMLIVMGDVNAMIGDCNEGY